MRAFVVAIVVAFAVQPAFADANEDAALLHLDRGVAAFDAKDFARALTEFTTSHELARDKANPYRWLALTEIQLGDCPAAVAHIDGFLSRVQPADPRVAEMTRWREFCQRKATPPQVTGTQGLAQSPPPPPPRKSLHERWWFWPVVGGAALAATGVTVYALTRSDGATMLPAIRCDATGCK